MPTDPFGGRKVVTADPTTNLLPPLVDGNYARATALDTVAAAAASAASAAAASKSIGQVTGLQGALDAKLNNDGDLATIAALSPPDGAVLRREGGTWIGTTPDQLKTALGLTIPVTEITVRWVPGVGWGSYSTDPNITRHFISFNDPAATEPHPYSDYDYWDWTAA